MDPVPSPPAPPVVVSTVAPPQAFEAYRLNDGLGSVRHGAALTVDQAVARRQSGRDVVVCGPNASANFALATQIERAVGPCRHHARHPRSGRNSLAHHQQRAAHPGHTFYEQPPSFVAV